MYNFYSLEILNLKSRGSNKKTCDVPFYVYVSTLIISLSLPQI